MKNISNSISVSADTLASETDISINNDLIPDTTNAYDLGTNIARFQDAYFYDCYIRNSRLIVNTGPDTRTVTIVSPAPNDTMTTNAGIQTLTNKTLTAPIISTISNTGTVTLPTSTCTLSGVGLAESFTGVKTFIANPVISQISNGTGVLSLPVNVNDTLVGRATTDALTNKSVDFGQGTALNYYDEKTHNTTWAGIWASAQTGNIGFVRIGKIVVLSIPDILATANTASIITISSTLPTEIRPSQKNDFPCRITDNGAQPTAAGLLRVNTNGTIEIYKDLSGANFTGSGNSGLQSTSISYRIT